MGTILGLGAVSYDSIMRIDHMPQWEELEYVTDYQVQQGGMAATGIVAAARLGAATEFIGAVSNDDTGTFHLTNFDRYGIRHDRIRIYENERNAVTVALVDMKTGKRTFIHYKGVNSKPSLSLGEFDFTGISYILYDGFFFDTALSIAEQAKKRGIVNVTDVSANNRNPRMRAYLELMDYPVLSEIFACAFTGIKDPVKAGRKLLLPANKAVIITCGIRGSYIITADGNEHIPAFEDGLPVDTTGAGDVFHGAFVFAISREYDLKDAVIFSSACSALKCRKPGGQAGIPCFNEVRNFILDRKPDAWLGKC